MSPSADKAPTPQEAVRPRILCMDGVDTDLCNRRLTGAPDQPLPEGRADRFSEAAAQAVLGGTGHLVLVYRNAVRSLQAGLRAQHPAAGILAAWNETGSGLLALRRQARRRVLLIEESALLHGTEAELAPLVTLLDGSLAAPLAAPDETPDILALVAIQALAADAQTQAIDMELEASSIATGEQPWSLEQIDAMTRNLHGLETEVTRLRTQQEDAAGTLATLTAERDLLMDQLSELHAEVQGQAGAAEALKQQLAKAEGQTREQEKALAEATARTTAARAERARQMEAVTAERDLLQAHIAQLKEEWQGQASATAAQAAERDLLLEHLAEVQAEARLRDQDLAQATRKVTDLDAALKAAQTTGQAQRQALTEEMTAKLQAARADTAKAETELTRVAAKLATLQRESAQQQQASSDEMVRSKQGAQGAVDAARKEAAEATQENARLTAELASLTAQKLHHAAHAARLARELDSAKEHWGDILAQAEQRELALHQGLENLTQEYSRLIASRSWRITEPLRAANTLLGRRNKGN